MAGKLGTGASTITTRLARAKDLDAVARLFDLYRQFYQQPPDPKLAKRYLRERFRKKQSAIYVAENAQGEIVGFTQLYPTFCSVRAAHTFVLYDLFVERAARRTGAGRALMQAAEAHCRKKGAARMELSTAKTNIPGQTLYESLAWIRDDAFYVYQKMLRT